MRPADVCNALNSGMKLAVLLQTSNAFITDGSLLGADILYRTSNKTRNDSGKKKKKARAMKRRGRVLLHFYFTEQEKDRGRRRGRKREREETKEKRKMINE